MKVFEYSKESVHERRWWIAAFDLDSDRRAGLRTTGWTTDNEDRSWSGRTMFSITSYVQPVYDTLYSFTCTQSLSLCNCHLSKQDSDLDCISFGE